MSVLSFNYNIVYCPVTTIVSEPPTPLVHATINSSLVASDSTRPNDPEHVPAAWFMLLKLLATGSVTLIDDADEPEEVVTEKRSENVTTFPILV